MLAFADAVDRTAPEYTMKSRKSGLRLEDRGEHGGSHGRFGVVGLALVVCLATPLPAGDEPPSSPPSAAVSDNEVRTSAGGLFDVHVRDLEISAALAMLSYQAKTNIVCGPGVTGTTSANLYGVTLQEALRAILTPGNFAFRTDGKTIFVGTKDEIAVQRAELETRVFRLKYVSASEAVGALKALLGDTAKVVPSGSIGGGGGTTAAPAVPAGQSSSGRRESEAGPTSGEYVIVTDTRPRLVECERLLGQLDTRPQQVLIEATMLRATLNEDNRYGVDFSLLGGVDFENVASISNAGADLRTGALPRPQLQDTTLNVGTDFSGAVQGGGFRFGLIHNNIAAFIRALEGVTDVTVVANPKVVALNRQEGEVIVGRRDGYLTTTVTQTAAIQSVEFLETGTQIRFRPTVVGDGAVRLEVHPKDSSGGLTSANLPFEETTEAHADILLRDGFTVLIGGLFRERTISSSERVPLIGSIPIAGLLFQNRTDQTVREEVIILLTVHVLKETDAESRAHEGLLGDVERGRVGARRGLLGTGRERLAQAFYQEALRQSEAGEIDKAITSVEIALHNHPRHQQAIRLREKLLDEQMRDFEGSRMRGFAMELIGAEADEAGRGSTPENSGARPPGPPTMQPLKPIEPTPAPQDAAPGKGGT
ncbi:MAG: hypothetical protein U1D55_17535 [Phycisphaerae bacterium]